MLFLLTSHFLYGSNTCSHQDAKYTKVRYRCVTLHFRDRHGRAWLCYRNRAWITFLMYVWTEAVSDITFLGYHEREDLRKRPKNNNKAWIKLSEAIFPLPEKSYPYHTPRKSDGRVLSKQGAPTTCNLTYWEVSQKTYVQTSQASWEWSWGKIKPYSGGVGEGEVSDKQPIAAICQNTFLQRAYCFFQIFQPKKKIAWRTDILRNRSIGCPWLSCLRKGTVWAISLRFVCLFQMPMNAPRQPSVTSSMATVPIPLVPTFVPAKLVSLVMEGTVLVRRIQICFCKNNHIPATNLTWIEK